MHPLPHLPSDPAFRISMLETMMLIRTYEERFMSPSLARFETAEASASIGQDVLLLAGSEDHYVPVQQWRDQIGKLSKARSITARLFTRSESAQNHCQVGNFGLALRTIVN